MIHWKSTSHFAYAQLLGVDREKKQSSAALSMGKLTGNGRISVFVIGFLDLLAVSLVIPALPVYLKSFGTSSTLRGVISSIYGALQLISSPVVGKWGDNVGRMKVLSICLLICAASYLSLAFFMQHLIWISVLRVIPGLFKHTQDISRCVLLEERKTSKNEVIGMFNAIASIGFIIGPTVHGHVVGRFGLENGFFISCVMCNFIFLVNFCITRTVQFSCDAAKTSTKLEENNGVKCSEITNGRANCNATKAKFSAFHKGVFASRFFLSLGVMMFRSSFVLWLVDCHPTMSSTTIGYILSFNGFLGLICGFLIGPVSKLAFYKDVEEKMHFHASVLLVVSFTLLLVSSNLWIVLVILTMVTMSTSVLRVCGVVLCVKHLSKDDIGRVHGLGSSVISIARFAAPLLVGLLQEISFSAPNHVALVFCVAGCLVYCKLSYPLITTKQKNE